VKTKMERESVARCSACVQQCHGQGDALCTSNEEAQLLTAAFSFRSVKRPARQESRNVDWALYLEWGTSLS
jgi:hypothetical protein